MQGAGPGAGAWLMQPGPDLNPGSATYQLSKQAQVLSPYASVSLPVKWV